MDANKRNPRAWRGNGGKGALQSKQSKYSTRPRIIQLFAWLSIIIGGAS